MTVYLAFKNGEEMGVEPIKETEQLAITPAVFARRKIFPGFVTITHKASGCNVTGRIYPLEVAERGLELLKDIDFDSMVPKIQEAKSAGSTPDFPDMRTLRKVIEEIQPFCNEWLIDTHEEADNEQTIPF